jgi:hypothetical protein
VGFGRWGFQKPGFCGWFPKITVISRKETRFLGLVAGVKETGFLWLVSQDNCDIPKRNPVSGFGFWVLLLAAKETGFLWWFPKITVISRKETRFLGLVAWGFQKPGFCGWFPKITVICF